MAKIVNVNDQIISNAIGPIMPHPPSLKLDVLAATKSPRSSALNTRLSSWVFGSPTSFRSSARSDAETWDNRPRCEKISPDIYKIEASRQVRWQRIHFRIIIMTTFL